MKTSVKRGRTAALRYRIADYSPCVVKILVRNSRGRVVKSMVVKGARPGTVLVKKFRCTLRKGASRWLVYATDSVGYRQVKPGSNRLVVR